MIKHPNWRNALAIAGLFLVLQVMLDMLLKTRITRDDSSWTFFDLKTICLAALNFALVLAVWLEFSLRKFARSSWVFFSFAFLLLVFYYLGVSLVAGLNQQILFSLRSAEHSLRDLLYLWSPLTAIVNAVFLTAYIAIASYTSGLFKSPNSKAEDTKILGITDFSKNLVWAMYFYLGANLCLHMLVYIFFPNNQDDIKSHVSWATLFILIFSIVISFAVPLKEQANYSQFKFIRLTSLGFLAGALTYLIIFKLFAHLLRDYLRDDLGWMTGFNLVFAVALFMLLGVLSKRLTIKFKNRNDPANLNSVISGNSEPKA